MHQVANEMAVELNINKADTRRIAHLILHYGFSLTEQICSSKIFILTQKNQFLARKVHLVQKTHKKLKSENPEEKATKHDQKIRD